LIVPIFYSLIPDGEEVNVFSCYSENTKKKQQWGKQETQRNRNLKQNQKPKRNSLQCNKSIYLFDNSLGIWIRQAMNGVIARILPKSKTNSIQLVIEMLNTHSLRQKSIMVKMVILMLNFWMCQRQLDLNCLPEFRI
jgi:hypothetical protein